MILTFYPDIYSEDLDGVDSRFKCLKHDQFITLPKYAFPQGFEPKHQVERPPNVLLPMAIIPEDDWTYLVYYIFYESLNDQLAESVGLFKDVLREVDENCEYPEDQDLDDTESLFSSDINRIDGTFTSQQNQPNEFNQDS